MKSCAHCGAGLLPGVEAAVCPECGKPLGEASGATQAQSTVALGDTGKTPTRIGPYKILEIIGEGGMGVVYRAEQTEPVRRKVALKLIKLGMDTQQVVARFESERQALALMDHPAIAKVFDGGATGDGRPYFVMEYVKGIPITEYCDKHKLGMKDRLNLFLSVCEGVQHAHQKGIIHRDLKPSNILVAIQEDRPVPKIIDFGVAKATDQRLTERTLFTQLGMLIGTPEYMSPEQAEMTGLDVDTRTDVYSLGVLLYELMTGSLPFTSEELRESGFDAFRRKIREEDPPKPSTRVSKLGGDTETVAAARGMHAKDLIQRLRGDLDWITIRSMDKDRTRRYGSPADLAADIKRYLTHEPVQATPPSPWYRTKKFVRRHKVGVVAASLVAIAVILGMVGTTLGLIRARTAEQVATQEAEAANAVSDFLVGLFEQANPWEAQSDSMLVREVLDRGAKRIESELEDQPLLKARMLDAIGESYEGLGLEERALPVREEALALRVEHLGPRDPRVGMSLVDVALARGALDKSSFSDKKAALKEVYAVADSGLAVLRASLPPNHLDLARALQRTADLYGFWHVTDRSAVVEGPRYLREALAIAEANGDLELAAEIRMDLSWFARQSWTGPVSPQDSGGWEESERLLLEALRDLESIGADLSGVQGALAGLYLQPGPNQQPEKALAYYLSSLEGREKVLGTEHEALLPKLANIAWCYDLLGERETAWRYMLRRYDILVGLEDADSTEIAKLMLGLAARHINDGNPDAAFPLFEQAVRFFGPDGVPYPGGVPLGTSVKFLERMGFHQAARKCEALANGQEARSLDRKGDTEAALRHGKRRLEMLLSLEKADTTWIAASKLWLAGFYARAGDLDRALPLFEQATRTLGWFEGSIKEFRERVAAGSAPPAYYEFRRNDAGRPEKESHIRDLLLLEQLSRRVGRGQHADLIAAYTRQLQELLEQEMSAAELATGDTIAVHGGAPR